MPSPPHFVSTFLTAEDDEKAKGEAYEQKNGESHAKERQVTVLTFARGSGKL